MAPLSDQGLIPPVQRTSVAFCGGFDNRRRERHHIKWTLRTLRAVFQAAAALEALGENRLQQPPIPCSRINTTQFRVDERMSRRVTSRSAWASSPAVSKVFKTESTCTATVPDDLESFMVETRGETGSRSCTIEPATLEPSMLRFPHPFRRPQRQLVDSICMLPAVRLNYAPLIHKLQSLPASVTATVALPIRCFLLCA